MQEGKFKDTSMIRGWLTNDATRCYEFCLLAANSE